MIRLTGIVLTLFLVGCATVGVEKVEQLKPGMKVVPLSTMGEKLAIRHIGTTVFQNKRLDLELPSWEIDRYTEELAARVIDQGGRFAAVTVDTTTARRSVGKLGYAAWTGGAVIQGGAASVTGLARDAGAELVLVLGPAEIGDPFFGSNQAFSGYGIGQRSFFGMQRAVDYLTMRVVLLDGKDGKEVARTHATLSTPRGAEDWIDDENLSLSETNALRTRSSIESLMDSALRKALTDLKLAR